MKLPIDLLDVELDSGLSGKSEYSQFSPLIWTWTSPDSDTGSTVTVAKGRPVLDTSVNVLDLLDLSSKNRVSIESVALLIDKVKSQFKFNEGKLLVLNAELKNAGLKLDMIETEMRALLLEYEEKLKTLSEFKAKLPDLIDQGSKIDVEAMKDLNQNYNQALDNVEYLNSKYSPAVTLESELEAKQREAVNLSIQLRLAIQNMIDNSRNYNDTTRKLTTKISAANRLRVNIERNLTAISFGLSTATSGLNLLTEKKGAADRQINSYRLVMDEVSTSLDRMGLELGTYERDIADAQSFFYDLQCYVRDRKSELAEITSACEASFKSIDFYHDLLVGGNYIQAGSNIKLGRSGCTVIVHAYLPDLPECPKPPVAPPIPGDVYILQEDLPICPAPICDPPTTTPPPTTTTTTTKPPPPASCNINANASGGPGVTEEVYTFAPWFGNIILTYDMLSVPDKAEIMFGDEVKATTGRPVSGKGTLTVNYPAGETRPVKVRITGNNGTAWSYTLRCE